MNAKRLNKKIIYLVITLLKFIYTIINLGICNNTHQGMLKHLQELFKYSF